MRNAVRSVAAIAVALPALLAGSAVASTRHADACDFGRLLRERVVLRPHAGTFYSQDVLNPDLIRRSASEYRLYFSGNNRPDAAGYWRTGLAVAESPLGPFRIRRRLRLPFLNGGTVRTAHRYYHGANVTVDVGGSGPPRLYQSRDGRDWRTLADIPLPPPPAWDALRSDLYLVARREGLDIYYAGRPGPSGADLGLLRYRHGRFTRGRRILQRSGGWDGLDLGEPAYFRARGREYLAYVGLGENGGPRRIGLAYGSRARWQRCTRPLVDLSPRYPQNAIDPEPLVRGGKLYLYFGGGSTPSLGGNMQGMIWLRVYALKPSRPASAPHGHELRSPGQ